MANKLLLIAAAACIAGGLTVQANAMPVSASGIASAGTVSAAGPVSTTAAPGSGAHLILVRQGCGGGFHRNGFGRCVPNRRVRRFYRRHWRPYRHCRVRWTYHGYRRVCRF